MPLYSINNYERTKKLNNEMRQTLLLSFQVVRGAFEIKLGIKQVDVRADKLLDLKRKKGTIH